MVRNPAVHILATLAVTVGLATIVYGEAIGLFELVVGGGVVVLIGIGLVTNAVARLDTP
jgi:hypothetical protein